METLNIKVLTSQDWITLRKDELNKLYASPGARGQQHHQVWRFKDINESYEVKYGV